MEDNENRKRLIDLIIEILVEVIDAKVLVKPEEFSCASLYYDQERHVVGKIRVSNIIEAGLKNYDNSILVTDTKELNDDEICIVITRDGKLRPTFIYIKNGNFLIDIRRV